MRCARGVVLVLAALLLPAALRAQLRDFCELSEVKVEPLPNAVCLRLKMDGLVRFTLEDTDVWQQDGDSGNWYLKPRSQFSLRLENVRPGTASMQDVGVYPVSHLAFQVPPGARESVGLICRLILYKPAYLTLLQTPNSSWDETGNARYRHPQVMVIRTQQQNEVLIIVTSDRQCEPRVERDLGPEREELEVSGTAEHLRVRAMNVDLHRLLSALAWQAGADISLDDRVQRQASACLEGLSLEQTLQILAAGYGLTVSQTAGGYYLGPALPDSPAAYQAASVRTIPLRYLEAEETPGLLPDLLLRYVRPNADGNSVVAVGPPEMLNKLEGDLRALDQPAPHCRLRAWLVSAEQSDEQMRSLLLEATGGTTAVQLDSSGQIRVEVARQDSSRLMGQLRALAQRERVKLLALPSLLVSNGEQAELFLGEQAHYWRLVGRREQELVLTPVQIGSRLRVRPRIAGEQIAARVSAENSSLIGDNGLGPLVERRSVDAEVRMASGQALLIGGLSLAGGDRSRREPAPGTGLGSLLAGFTTLGRQNELWVIVEAQVREPETALGPGPREDMQE